MSTIRVVNVQHTDATEPNIVLQSDGTSVFASGITISGGTNLTVSGTAEFASGTVSAPGITFIDDNNTGIYEPAADTVAITTAATERLRVDSSGRVGVGTSTPGSFQAGANNLVVGTGSGDNGISIFAGSANEGRIYFARTGELIRGQVKYDFSADKMHFAVDSSNKLTIDSSGNLGIGITSPEEILHVAAESELVNSRDGVMFQSTSSLAADTGLPLVFTSHIGTQSNYGVASIAGRKENATSGNAAGYLQFATGNSSGSVSERMRIDSSGRLLLGTTQSGYNNARLQIAGVNSSNYLSFLNTTASDSDNHGWSVIAFRRTQSGGEVSTCAGITGRHDGSGDDQKGKLEMGTNDGNDNNGFQVRMEMDSTGYVRLTSQSPGLQFNGDTAATNALDDYEEGTFTPTLTFATPGTSSFGYTAQTGGRYTKIGRFVHCRIEIRLNSFSKGTASGDLQIDGLPFSATGGGSFGQFIGNFASFQAPLPTAAGNFPIVLVLLNQNKAQFKVIVNNANWATFPDPDSNSQYKIDLQYYV